MALLLALLFVSCGGQKAQQGEFSLQGAWLLENKVYFSDPDTVKFDTEDNTLLRIYDDSCYYACQFMAAPSGRMVVPSHWENYTLKKRGERDYLYLQEDDTHPLTVVNDSTMVIQEIGCRFTWRRCSTLDEERMLEIRDIIKNDVGDDSDVAHRYIFSYAERKLQTANHTLIYVLIAIVLGAMVFSNYVYQMFRKKKHVEQQLRLLEQERTSLPEPVRKAMNTVEEDFLHSEYYLSLRRKISEGGVLSRAEWEEFDVQFQQAYPHFNSSLFTLHSMSQVELRVCQLLKLGCAPSEIASTLCKDASSISTTRSRLYKKVFNRKGSSKEWDEFVRSL